MKIIFKTKVNFEIETLYDVDIDWKFKQQPINHIIWLYLCFIVALSHLNCCPRRFYMATLFNFHLLLLFSSPSGYPFIIITSWFYRAGQYSVSNCFYHILKKHVFWTNPLFTCLTDQFPWESWPPQEFILTSSTTTWVSFKESSSVEQPVSSLKFSFGDLSSLNSNWFLAWLLFLDKSFPEGFGRC